MVSFQNRCHDRWKHNDCKAHMLFNWDQLWKNKHRPKAKKLHKIQRKIGQPKRQQLNADQSRAVKRARAECGAEDLEEPVAPKRQRRKRLAAQGDAPDEDVVRIDPVKGAKDSITVVLSTFGSGHKGPMLLHPRSGHWPEALINKYNNDPQFHGRMRIICSGSDTHMMNSETTIQMVRALFKPALRIHREDCVNSLKIAGATLADKSGFVADAFTGNFSHKGGEDKRRETVADECNALLPLEPDGGWSAAGQPCDFFICMFRKYCDLYGDWALGRTTLDHNEIGTIWLNAQGTPKLCL